VSNNAATWDPVLHDKIAALGASMGGEVRSVTSGLYEALQTTEIEHAVVRDLSYGPHERQLLDVHTTSSGAPGPSPVLCFVHGGGFSGGDKGRAGNPYYDNIARWAVGSGFVAVNLTYRLAPEFTYPVGAEDVARALTWVNDNIAEYGGDPAGVVIMGHSAGASHVATALTAAAPKALLARMPAGAILSSGIFDPSLEPRGYGSYFGEDTAELEKRSSVNALCELDIPVLVSTAQFDPPEIQMHTRRLVDAYFDSHHLMCDLVQAEGHNHFSVMFHVGTDETWLTDRFSRFVERCS
jgi:acetyl esterase/lipase